VERIKSFAMKLDSVPIVMKVFAMDSALQMGQPIVHVVLHKIIATYPERQIVLDLIKRMDVAKPII
jgi:hypothetical protein